MELQQQVDVAPVVGETNPPDYVVMPLSQIVRDIGGVDLFEGIEVELVDPRLPHKADEQLFDHPRMGEKQSVALVEFRHLKVSIAFR